MAKSRYLPDPTSPWLLYLILPAGVTGIVMLAIAILHGGGWQLALFGLAWIAAFAWNAYIWLFRITYKLRLRDTQLIWYRPFRNGIVPVADIRSIETASNILKLVTISLASGDRIIVRNHRNFDKFLHDLVAENPNIYADDTEFSSPFPERHVVGGYLTEDVNNRWK